VQHVPGPQKTFEEGRKAIITNKFNFDDIENPFAVHDLTLGTVKIEKHRQWLAKKQARKETILAQIKDQEKKMKIYKKYNKE